MHVGVIARQISANLGHSVYTVSIINSYGYQSNVASCLIEIAFYKLRRYIRGRVISCLQELLLFWSSLSSIIVTARK